MKVVLKSILVGLMALPTLVYSQNIGDTIAVKAMDYNSTSRDTMVAFPAAGVNSFEKVVMRYAMRCKDGLVSQGTTGQTNIGCGEWDYSCNTYLTDSTRADSLPASIEKYLIYPAANATNIYGNDPTWNAFEVAQTNVDIVSTISETDILVGTGSDNNTNFINSQNQGGKTYALFTAAELIANGMIAGEIDAFSLNNLGGQALLQSFQVEFKNSNLTNLDFPTAADLGSMQEVFFQNYTFSAGSNRIQFHTPFIWDGTSNVLVAIANKGTVGNAILDFESNTTLTNNVMYSANDLSYKFIPGSYIETNSYKGVSASNPRTVEVWIKTSVAGRELVSWGLNATGQKFSFRLEGSGFVRLEINGGFKVGTTVLNDNNWHHIAMVFNGTTMNDVDFYVDGAPEAISSINSIDLISGTDANVTISKGFHDRFWEGQIDNVRIWNTPLSLNEINDWRFKKLNNTHPKYANLELAFTAPAQGATILDESPNGNDGYFKYLPDYTKIYGSEHFKEFTSTNLRPNITFYQGDYNLTVTTVSVFDTIMNSGYQIIENTILSNTGTIYSDDIATSQTQYYPVESNTYDLGGNLINTITSTNTTSITNTVLDYMKRFPMKMELMSFVTPYGINLDLGMEGKAWYFDVTDYLPVLSGNRNISLERGGEWQEDMDIQFYFIVGTPPQEVVDIQQIWKVDSRGYADIMADNYFAPKTITLKNNTSHYKIRTAITGHGQEGEFIPRTHYINVNGGATEFSWNVWKYCGQNPVFPQGGTWIYDRAGWCPGMPTDTKEWDITNYVNGGSTVEIDYGINTASGTSNYIVNNQLVSYGAPNHSLDARISGIISPTSNIEQGRLNPICGNPVVELQNVGSTVLTSATITYSVNNGAVETFNWTGNLSFMEKVQVTLPANNTTLWNSVAASNNIFNVNVTMANNSTDEYVYNNQMTSSFEVPDMVPAYFYVLFKTNSAAAESSFDLQDAQGNVLFQRNSLTNNTIYKDTFNLNTGCYTLNIYDSGNDGISFWANSDGSGYIQLREVGAGILKSFQTDFGGDVSYNFTVVNPLSTGEIEIPNSMIAYPNPTSSIINVEVIGLKNGEWSLCNSLGQNVLNGNIDSNELYKMTLDLSSQPAGLYFLKANNGIQSNSIQISKK